MGKKQRDCAGCGAPVGIIGREHCCLCQRKITEAAARTACPGCGKLRVLHPDTGRCVLCSRACAQCGHPVRHQDAALCRDCRRKARQAAAQQPCPRCGRQGYLRAGTGWCGPCSRPRRPKDPPRECAQCGQIRRHQGLGLCSACWQRRPERPFVQAAHLAARLADPPGWLDGFIAHLAAGHGPARACTMITELGRLLGSEHPGHPRNLLERARRPGRSMGSLARALEDYFTAERLAMPTDQAERLAAGRRQRRINAVPAPLRPAAARFCEHMLAARQRARRAGTRPRDDHTIETALAIVRDLAGFLTSQRGKQDWALTDVHDIEAFLGTLPKARRRRLTVLRQFFRFTRTRKIILADPTLGLIATAPRGFTGQTIILSQQRALFRRWTTGTDAHPHEALLGILALLHGASSSEVRHLQATDIDPGTRTIRLGKRPHPVPLDPASWQILQRCLAHRGGQRTGNPHVIVTKGTKAGRAPASAAYFSHVLDPCGVPPRMLRCTRLADLVNTMDPKLVAAAFGMNPEGVMIYLADHVDPSRLPFGPEPRPRVVLRAASPFHRQPRGAPGRCDRVNFACRFADADTADAGVAGGDIQRGQLYHAEIHPACPHCAQAPRPHSRQRIRDQPAHSLCARERRSSGDPA
jgi:integrase